MGDREDVGGKSSVAHSEKQGTLLCEYVIFAQQLGQVPPQVVFLIVAAE